MSEERYNIAILGKTGVGKSSLINYLFNEKVAEAGVGKPVTEAGFHKYDTIFKKLPVTIFDTMGLEVGNAVEWENILDEELKKRSTDKSVEDWFHTIYYCIGAGGSRVEDFEIKLLKNFISKKYTVIIIFTKADQASETDLEKLKKVLLKSISSDIKVISVCSQEKRLCSGYTTKPFGKDNIELETYNNFWDSISLRLPERCIKVIEQEIDAWEKKQLSYISSNITNFNGNEIQEEIQKRSDEFVNNLTLDLINPKIQQELKTVMELYAVFSEKLDYPPKELILNKKIELHISKSELEGLRTYILKLPITISKTVFEYTVTTGKKIIDFFHDTIAYGWDSYFDAHTYDKDVMNPTMVHNRSKLSESVKRFVDDVKKEIKELEPYIDSAIKKSTDKLKATTVNILN